MGVPFGSMCGVSFKRAVHNSPPAAIFVLLIAALTVLGIRTATDQKLLPSRT